MNTTDSPTERPSETDLRIIIYDCFLHPPLLNRAIASLREGLFKTNSPPFDGLFCFLFMLNLNSNSGYKAACGCSLLRSQAHPVGDPARRSKPSAGVLGRRFMRQHETPFAQAAGRLFESSRGNRKGTRSDTISCAYFAFNILFRRSKFCS